MSVVRQFFIMYIMKVLQYKLPMLEKIKVKIVIITFHNYSMHTCQGKSEKYIWRGNKR